MALPLLFLPILAVYRSTTISAEKQHLALHDSLTDLPNRFNFMTVLARAIEHAGRRPGAGAVLLIDLDRFKEINDTLGHQAGDDLLRMIGPRIMEVLPPAGSVARLGGDEFAVLLPALADEHEATLIAHRIADALDTPFWLEGFNIEVGASIGVAIYPSDGGDGDVLLKRADVAMYLAKSRRTTVERYDAQLDHHSTRRLELVGELRTAIAAGDVQLYYQPKLDLATGDVCEVEALVRWVHPRLGVVPPSEFVALAEHTGLIRPLTSHVLRQAVLQAARWSNDGAPLTVAVNLSARSLHDGAILQEVLGVLNASHLPPSLLRLEITESSIMADPQHAKKVLEQLHDMGIRLSIDDFGTGYSSLAYLRELPVSEIKIDRSFMTNVLAREDDRVIVRSTIDLARNLGLTSVAEGVESAEVLQWLVAAGCNHAQGYHIARPMTAAALDEWLDAHRPDHSDRRTMTPLVSVIGAAGC
jgi:diguanylate cyclase (GGDEF)-like protein